MLLLLLSLSFANFHTKSIVNSHKMWNYCRIKKTNMHFIDIKQRWYFVALLSLALALGLSSSLLARSFGLAVNAKWFIINRTFHFILAFIQINTAERRSETIDFVVNGVEAENDNNNTKISWWWSSSYRRATEHTSHIHCLHKKAHNKFKCNKNFDGEVI